MLKVVFRHDNRWHIIMSIVDISNIHNTRFRLLGVGNQPVYG